MGVFRVRAGTVFRGPSTTPCGCSRAQLSLWLARVLVLWSPGACSPSCHLRCAVCAPSLAGVCQTELALPSSLTVDPKATDLLE